MLQRVYFTFLKAHTHIKPTMDGVGWQVIHASVLLSFVDDLFVYGMGTAWHNFRVTVGRLWEVSANEQE